MRLIRYLLLMLACSAAVAGEQDITVKQGAQLNVTLTGSEGTLTGRTLRMHVRSKVGVTSTKFVASTTTGELSIASASSATLTVGADVLAAVPVTLPVEYWVYDVESYTTSADVRREFWGRVTITRDVTRDTEAATETALAGAVLYSGPQSLTTAQKLQARDNIGAGTGGGGGAAAWGDITGTLSAQIDLNTALGLKAPLASPTFTGTPAAPTAAGATSTTQIATTAFVGGEITTHAAATDPHGDRAFATAADSTHSALTTGVHGITAAGAALVDDASASAQRTTLGLGTAATTAATDYATAAQGTDDRTASGLRTASTVVSVSAATAPSSGQVLTATGSTAATWQTPSGGGGSPAGSSGQMQYNNASAFGAANFWRESADIIAQRNSTTAQTFYVYDTYTDASNYGRLAFNTSLTGDWLQIAAETAGTGADNYGLALTPSGTGAIVAHVPDSTAAGGNARGSNAVDWQRVRATAAQVASGTTSTVGGGANNTASGTSSTVAGGSLNSASGNTSTVSGGASNSASAVGAATGGGSENTATGAYSWIPGGYQASSRGLLGAYAYSAGRRSATGDAQVIGQPVRRTTTDATPVSLATDGTPAATTVMVLPASSMMACEALVGMKYGADSAGYRLLAVFERDGSNNTSLVGSVTKTVIAEDAGLSGADATLVANDTLESAEIQVTGPAGTAYSVGELKCVQVL